MNTAIRIGEGCYMGHVMVGNGDWDYADKVYGMTISKKNVVYKIPGSLFCLNGKLKKNIASRLYDGLLEPEDEDYLISRGVEIKYKAGARRKFEEWAEAGWEFVA